MLETDKIIILGGGSAGWMTAATLIKLFPKKDITVIESPLQKSVGVGESTLGQINEWLDLLDIKDKDFMPYCDASYKLSIRFENFYKLKDGGFHYPFGSTFEDRSTGSKEFWFFKKKFNPNLSIQDYANSISPNMWLVNNNVLFNNEDNKIPLFNFKHHVAYHFDAVKFAEWLKIFYCIPKGVKHIVENIETIEQDEDGIKSLNNKYCADLYMDCTGFSSLLLGKTLKEPFNDYSSLLPNDSAWATNLKYTNKEKQIKPYTNCTAIDNGWVWNIPSWNKIGTGYVYSSSFVSDDNALKEFTKYLGHENLDFKKIKMRVGIHNRIFVKNVCAIGLAAGFIEPLESTSLFNTHHGILGLMDILMVEKLPGQFARDRFNHDLAEHMDGWREFVEAHYYYSTRRDTPFWRAVTDEVEYKQEGTHEAVRHMMVSGDPIPTGHMPIAFILAGSGFTNINKRHYEYFGYPITVPEKTVDMWYTNWEARKKLAGTLPTMYEFLSGTFNYEGG